MLSKDEKKEHAERIRDQLMKELGQEEFKRLFEETRKNWILEVGAWPSPSQENLIFALDYSLSEQKRRKAFEQQLVSKFDFKGNKVGVCHDGKHWKIYYFPIGYFQVDLQTMGKFLESLEEKGETETVIIPNLSYLAESD